MRDASYAFVIHNLTGKTENILFVIITGSIETCVASLKDYREAIHAAVEDSKEIPRQKQFLWFSMVRDLKIILYIYVMFLELCYGSWNW